jgi:hypothetical protein
MAVEHRFPRTRCRRGSDQVGRGPGQLSIGDRAGWYSVSHGMALLMGVQAGHGASETNSNARFRVRSWLVFVSWPVNPGDGGPSRRQGAPRQSMDDPRAMIRLIFTALSRRRIVLMAKAIVCRPLRRHRGCRTHIDSSRRGRRGSCRDRASSSRVSSGIYWLLGSSGSPKSFPGGCPRVVRWRSLETAPRVRVPRSRPGFCRAGCSAGRGVR